MRSQANIGVRLTILGTILSAGGFANGQPIGAVTIVSGDDVILIRDGESTPVHALELWLQDREVEPGDQVATTSNGTVVVHFSDYGTTASLQSASKLLLEKLNSSANDDSLTLRLLQGRVLVTRKASQTGPIVLVGESGQAVGHIRLSEGMVLLAMEGTSIQFTTLAGEAIYFEGAVSGKSKGEGRRVPAGQMVSVTAGPAPTDLSAAQTLYLKSQEQAVEFGLVLSNDWLQRAEEGDFTPVRSDETRSEVELVGTSFSPRQAFDQPTQLAVVSTPQQVGIQSLRTVINPAQGLVQSGIPGSVIAGQRFRRSIIIGNPGTAGSGPITINPSAELLIRLAGQ